jgi:hypothetical protein
MPSELQDRIAVAIYEADPDKSWSAWGGLTRREQSGYMQTALAVMKAMREPTLEMLEAGDTAYRATHTSGVSGMTIDAQLRARFARFSAGYRAALDAEISIAEGGRSCP